MRNAIAGVWLGVVLAGAAGQGLAQTGGQGATITVRGRGEVAVPPDEVMIGMGAVAQADRAEAAQGQVNAILSKAINSITAAGVPANRIQTTGIMLSPVYSGVAPARAGGTAVSVVQEPRVVGYRASNVLRVQLSNLKQLGQVIDQAVTAGANQLEDLRFLLKDDQPPRQEALRLAAADARSKAEAIAAALDVQILGVKQVEEAGVEMVRPQMQYRELAAAQGAIAATPVQPGEVRVEAAVTVSYLIGRGGGAAGAAVTTQPQGER